MKCEVCDRKKANPSVCNGCGRRHWHGRVHTHLGTKNGSLAALCGECLHEDRAAMGGSPPHILKATEPYKT